MWCFTYGVFQKLEYDVGGTHLVIGTNLNLCRIKFQFIAMKQNYVLFQLYRLRPLESGEQKQWSKSLRETKTPY